MMNTFTKQGLFAFLDMNVEKGWVNLNTGNGRRAACKAVLDDTPMDADLTGFDVRAAVVRFHNRNPGALSPESLREYERRVSQALKEFSSWLSDPTSYKPPARTVKPGAVGKRKKPSNGGVEKEAPRANESDASAHRDLRPLVPLLQVPPQATEAGLVLPFPIRQNFLAQLVVPRDMTREEANRLCQFVQALAQEAPPAS